VTAKEHMMDIGNRLSALNTRDRRSSSSSNKSFKTNVTNYCTRHGIVIYRILKASHLSFSPSATWTDFHVRRKRQKTTHMVPCVS